MGPDHSDTASSLDNLGQILLLQGDLAGARPIFERALAIHEQTLGLDHLETANSLNSLAVLLEYQGDLHAARPMLERALAIYEKASKSDSDKALQCLNNLAVLWYSQGDLDRARPLYERVLAVRERAPWPDHRETANSLNNLASLLNAQGNLAAARPMYERAVGLFERAVGANHPLTATALGNLASVVQEQGELAAARPLRERALAIARANLDRASSAQSDRQQLAMVHNLRHHLDSTLSFAVLAGWPGDESYRHALAWKGAVLSQQRRERGLRPEDQEVRARLRDAARRLATKGLASPNAPDRRAAWRDEVAALTREVEGLEAELAARNADLRRAREAAWRGPTEVRAALPPGVVLVDLHEYNAFLPRVNGNGKRVFERRAAGVRRPGRPADGDGGPRPGGGDRCGGGQGGWRGSKGGGVIRARRGRSYGGGSGSRWCRIWRGWRRCWSHPMGRRIGFLGPLCRGARKGLT